MRKECLRGIQQSQTYLTRTDTENIRLAFLQGTVISQQWNIQSSKKIYPSLINNCKSYKDYNLKTLQFQPGKKKGGRTTILSISSSIVISDLKMLSRQPNLIEQYNNPQQNELAFYLRILMP